MSNDNYNDDNDCYLIDFYLDDTDTTDEQNDLYSFICNSIAQTITYEVDEDSLVIDSNEESATVDIIYTIIDYQSIFDEVVDEGGDVNDFVAALSNGGDRTTEIRVTIGLVLFDNGIWFVDDSRGDSISNLYRFYHRAYRFLPLSDYVRQVEWGYSNENGFDIYQDWFWGDSNEFNNVAQICLRIVDSTEEGSNIEWYFDYEYFLNGESVAYFDNRASWAGSYPGASFGLYNGSGAEYPQSGEYRCVIYDSYGNTIAESTCTVNNG